MYATINIPGSSHFEYYGPASRQACQDWLNTTIAKRSKTELIASLLPQQIVSNKEAESWRYRDGSKVIQPGGGLSFEEEFGREEPCGCGCPGEAHYKSCPGYQPGNVYTKQYKGDREETFFVPTDDGEYIVYHFSTAGSPEAHDTKSGEWFFQPSKDAPVGEVWSVGYRTPRLAINAAEAEGAELAIEKALEL